MEFIKRADFARVLSHFIDSLVGKNPTETLKALKDRLGVLHLQNSDTFTLFTTHLSAHFPAQYEAEAKAGSALISALLKSVDLREMQEFKLKEAGYSVNAYLDYIGFELSKLKEKDAIPRVMALYERSLETHSTSLELWNAYLCFLFNHFKTSYIVIVSERALTKMGHFDLWKHALAARERYDPDRLTELYSQGISYFIEQADVMSLFGWILARCHCQRRVSVQSTVEQFQYGIDLIKQILPDGDPSHTLEFALAQFYIDTRDLENARKVYNDITKSSPTLTVGWASFISFESGHGDKARVSSLYRQAFSRNLDSPELLLSSWVEFEERCGTLDSYYEALEKTRALELKLAKKRELVEEESHGNKRMDISPVPSPPQKKSKLKHEPKPKEQPIKDESSPMDAEPEKKKASLSEFKEVENSMAGQMVYIPGLGDRVTLVQVKHAFAPFGRIVDATLGPNPDSGILEAFIEFDKPEIARMVVEKGSLKINDQEVIPERCRPSNLVWRFKSSEEKNKVYVSHLPLSIEKQTLRDLFEEFGKVKEIRLIVKKAVAFAYIEYESESEASMSLALNGHAIDGSIISVALSDPTKSKKLETDEKQLYVTNVASSLVSSDLESLFGKYGALAGVSMTPGKGFAFIRFEGDESARKALAELNGKMIDGRVLSVTVADPNFRKGKSFEEYTGIDPRRMHRGNKPVSSQPPKSHEPAKTSTSGSSLSFKPRSAAVKPKPRLNL